MDLVLCARDGFIEAHTRDGSVGFDREGARWVKGRNPLERQDAGAFTPLEQESARRRPRDNHYPFAYSNAAQLFDNPNAPDIAVVHTPAHNWEERGGHRGEHGSLDVVQSRAPLIVSGAGARALGRIGTSARMVDIAPTIAALAGVEAPRAGDGRSLTDIVAAGAGHVVAFLWDGTNANVLYALADAGELPNVARLMAGGTTFAHGCVASFPSVTLANHTTAVTGAHPGRHGVLNNFYYDRARREQVVANSPTTWHLAREKISGDVETIFEAVARSGGGFTAAVNEPADRGASYATFDLVRAAGGAPALQAALPAAADVPGSTKAFVDVAEYGWSGAADHIAVRQVTELWGGSNGNPRPRVLWVNLILPDAANHAGGPYSDIGHAGLRDTDARLGAMLDVMDPATTAFILFADHGMEESDPACKGDFDEALTRAGIAFRDEGYGFIYLDP